MINKASRIQISHRDHVIPGANGVYVLSGDVSHGDWWKLLPVQWNIKKFNWYLQDVGDHSNGPAVDRFTIRLLGENLWSW